VPSLYDLVAGEDDQLEGLLSFCSLLGPVLDPHQRGDHEPLAMLGKVSTASTAVTIIGEKALQNDTLCAGDTHDGGR
jgi:hypothetical protein